jgi:hypothetical protein
MALFLLARRSSRHSVSLVIVLLFAILFRLTLLFSGPVLSFDMFRYYWDGKVAASGINPYIYSPDASELSSLRDSNWQFINHKDLKTAYPPLMELFFEAIYISFRSALAYKISFFLFDVGIIALVLLTLEQMDLDTRNLIVYAWAPLPILEISQSGHNDSIAVFFVLLSFLLLLRKRNGMSAGVMGLSVVSKFYPIFFAPILFKRWGVRGTLVFILTVVGFYIPFAGIGLKVFYGMPYAVNESLFNGSVFPLIRTLFRWSQISSDPGFPAQLIVYAIYGGLLLWALRLSLRDEADTSRLMKLSFLLTGAVLLLNRSFFAWYMTWMIPFLAFYSTMSWLLLSGGIFLGYMKYDAFPPPPYEGVDPQTALAIDLVQYLPFYALLVYELAKKRIMLKPSRDQKLP